MFQETVQRRGPCRFGMKLHIGIVAGHKGRRAAGREKIARQYRCSIHVLAWLCGARVSTTNDWGHRRKAAE